MNKCIVQGIKALVGAALLVLLAKVFAFVSCTIPSTGMENSLYKGERVLVNKWSYGLRLPFSTVRLRPQQVHKGDVVLFNNPYSAKTSTPICLRDPFISRCIALPGDTLMLNNELFAVAEQLYLPHSKSLYTYSALYEDSLQLVLQRNEIFENPLVGYSEGKHIRAFSRDEYWQLQQQLPPAIALQLLYQVDDEANYPLVIPAKGVTLAVDKWNAMLFCNTINQHEGKEATIQNDTLLVAGKATTHYTFTKDYYWMAANNPVNMTDSRLFGLVPADHLIGKVWLIWYSANEERLFQRLD